MYHYNCSIFIIVISFLQTFYVDTFTNKHLNTIEDLFSLTNSTSTIFNLTDWICIDYYLTNLETIINNKYDLAHCNCFINVQCSKLVINNEAIQPESMFWLRCYDLFDFLILERFIETLPQNLIEYSGKTHDQCLKSNVYTLRTDFVRCNGSNVFEFVRKIDSPPKKYLLESLSINDSNLTEIPNWLFRKFHNLHSLNLTSNKIIQFLPQTDFIEKISRLTKIDLSKNHLKQVDLSRFISLRSINLSNNNLTTLLKNNLFEDFLNSLEMDNLGETFQLNVKNNPWNCNEDIDWLIDLILKLLEKNNRTNDFANDNIHNNKGKLNVNEFFSQNEPECSEPLEAKMFPFSFWKSIKESPICKNCNCFLRDKHIDAGYRYTIVNCTNRNLDLLPIKLPKNTKILDLSNNYIRNLHPLSKYHGYLNGWRDVYQIILSNNSLETLDGLELISSHIFLDVSGNLLTEIPYHVFNKILSNKIDKFRIGNNPFVCDCNTVKMQKWLQNHYHKILDVHNIHCGYLRLELEQTESENPLLEQAKNGQFFNKEIIHIDPLQLCPSSNSYNLIDILNIILIVSVLFLIIKVIYDFYWQKRTGKLPRFFKLNI